ncbi:DUF3649 domain-containing protein [Sessilibacter corallicola]|uniref:DUF3649 domain-containing protein n=1 Tax=Sessilibacter corallicola TaxID=2904075 RepID=UPI00333F2A46
MQMHPKLLVTFRVIAAVFIGYLVATASGIFLSLILPTDDGSAFVFGIMTTFAVWVVAIMWSFYASSLKRVWLGLLIPAVLLGCLIGLVRSFS